MDMNSILRNLLTRIERGCANSPTNAAVVSDIELNAAKSLERDGKISLHYDPALYGNVTVAKLSKHT